MKIKIIDLLIKIAKKEAPEKIMYDGDIWNFDGSVQDYSDGTKYLFADYMSDFAYKPEFLNDEVEIIEEEKEIEKLGKNFTFENDTSELAKNDWQVSIISQKINELVDEINKLKKEK